MLHRKTKFLAFALLCAALISGAAIEIRAQDSTTDNSAQTATKAQIPAALIARWKKSAEQGNADAQFLLGNAYYTGNGVDQDFNKAVSWWHKAADQGNVSAQKALDQLVPK